MQPNEITEVLNRPISQELLARDVTRLAYVAKDGTPRNVPIGFTWNGSEIVMCRLTESPIVELNRAIAVAEVDGPEAGLRIVDRVGLNDFRYLHSTRADLLRRLGRSADAREAYRRALVLTEGDAERRFVERRLTELGPERRNPSSGEDKGQIAGN